MEVEKKKVKSIRERWVKRIQDFYDNGFFPKRWKSSEQLANLIVQIDPYLLNSTPLDLSRLFGKKNDKPVLPLESARRLMLCDEWEKVKWDRLQATIGDNLKRIGDKSVQQLESKIDEGQQWAVVKGLEISGVLQKNVNIKHIDDKEKARKLGKLTAEYLKEYTSKNVEKLDGNH